MSSTVKATITQTSDGQSVPVNHLIQFNSKFFEDNPSIKPEELNNYSLFKLLSEYKLGTYFHNETGPSWQIVDTKNNKVVHEEFWLNGNRVTDEEQIKKMKHDQQFSKAVDSLINE